MSYINQNNSGKTSNRSNRYNKGYNPHSNNGNYNAGSGRKPHSVQRGDTSRHSDRKGGHKGGQHGFQRPGPFGFKPVELPPKVQAVANPFGFASHHIKGAEPSESEEERKQQKTEEGNQPERRHSNKSWHGKTRKRKEDNLPKRFVVPTFDGEGKDGQD